MAKMIDRKLKDAILTIGGVIQGIECANLNHNPLELPRGKGPWYHDCGVDCPVQREVAASWRLILERLVDITPVARKGKRRNER